MNNNDNALIENLIDLALARGITIGRVTMSDFIKAVRQNDCDGVCEALSNDLSLFIDERRKAIKTARNYYGVSDE